MTFPALDKDPQKDQTVLDLLLTFERLKQIPRTGWMLRGIRLSDAESVAEHQSMTGLVVLILSLILENENITVDASRLGPLALTHDLPEVLMGDLDRGLNVFFGIDFPSKKTVAERKAIDTLFGSLPQNIQQYFSNLWNESQEDTTESRLLKIADRIEAALQAISYIQTGYPKKHFKTFFASLSEITQTMNSSALNDLVTQLLDRYEQL